MCRVGERQLGWRVAYSHRTFSLFCHLSFRSAPGTATAFNAEHAKNGLRLKSPSIQEVPFSAFLAFSALREFRRGWLLDVTMTF
jgi:hypothetical protein